METIGLIGIGVMGRTVAAKVIEGGHPVLAYDVSPACIEPTVVRPTTLPGWRTSTRGSRAARWNSASALMPICTPPSFPWGTQHLIASKARRMRFSFSSRSGERRSHPDPRARRHLQRHARRLGWLRQVTREPPVIVPLLP